MYKAIFYENVYNNADNFLFEKDKYYDVLLEDDGYVLIRQPNCPKNENWATKFPSECNGKEFKIVES